MELILATLVIPTLRDFIIAIFLLVILGAIYIYLLEPNVPDVKFKAMLRLLVGVALAVGILAFFGIL